ncbi:reverse transcriptase-like protein [Novosphingobium sp. FSW06-99]|uniref:reverse transcriptase-like protein n=1 Tax=Novosphingobium sp. FSW06-99 TaxID=1739113 RepID=UPI00076C7568|nr:reverse transcriptase-like protein [Novosphingobium sp. FSW06-99]KUR78082.1 ribonuclease HI [Novosphingobium sp. FSW06-99]
MKIWFDGGCRPNPGVIETAVVTGGRVWHRGDHGQGDNNDAEWLALLDAIAVARDLGLRDVVLLGDAVMVVDQASGRARRVPERFRGYLARFRALAAGFARVRVRHVARAHNLAGIALQKGHA